MAKRGRETRLTSRRKTTASPPIRGANAAQKYRTLPDPRMELVVTCEYTGRNHMVVRFGKAGDQTYFVYAQDSLHGDVIVMGSQLDAPKIFEQWAGYLSNRQAFVNSSPTSPDYFGTDVDLDELPRLLHEKLGITIKGAAWSS